MLTLTSLTAPLASATAFSSAGPSVLQGPHHGAQKSTITGTARDASRTSAANVSSVLSLMCGFAPAAACCWPPWGLAADTGRPVRPGRWALAARKKRVLGPGGLKTGLVRIVQPFQPAVQGHGVAHVKTNGATRDPYPLATLVPRRGVRLVDRAGAGAGALRERSRRRHCRWRCCGDVCGMAPRAGAAVFEDAPVRGQRPDRRTPSLAVVSASPAFDRRGRRGGV